MYRIIFILSIALFTAPLFADEAANNGEFKRLYAEFNELYANSEELDPIIEVGEKLYALAPSVYGENSKNTANIIYNLATLYDEKGGRSYYSKYEKKASALYKEYFIIQKHLNIPEDKQYFERYLQFVLADFNAYAFEPNISYSKKALKIADNINLPDIEKANLEYLIGIMRANSRHPLAARKLLESSKSRYVNHYGEKNISVARIYFWLGKVGMVLGNSRNAEENFIKALDIFEVNDQLNDDLILSCHAFLVELYEKTGKTEKATFHSRAVAVERPVDFDRFITPLYRKNPEFPPKTRVKGMFASVEMEFNVDVNGFPKDIKILKSSNSMFNKTSIKSLGKSRFAPSIKDGKFIETKGVKHKYTYTIQ